MYRIKKGGKTNYKRSKIERKTKTKYNKLKLRLILSKELEKLQRYVTPKKIKLL